jgi:hypothetical protein
MTVTTLDNGGFGFFRDLGDITVDTINVEHVEVNALGGDDTVDGSDALRRGPRNPGRRGQRQSDGRCRPR